MADRLRVVLIGDSIRLAYQPLVAEQLAAVAEVSGPAENCGDSENVRARLGGWLDADATLVVFNAGLHDIRRSHVDGRCRVEIARYEKNLATIVGAIRETGAAVAFATTTPVDDRRHATSRKETRLDADVRRYNAAARRVMAALAVPMLDLYGVVGANPAFLAVDGAHLTSEGDELVAAAVAAGILDLL